DTRETHSDSTRVQEIRSGVFKISLEGAFAPKALPPSLKLRRTAAALVEAARRASQKLAQITSERRREAFSRAHCRSSDRLALRVLFLKDRTSWSPELL